MTREELRQLAQERRLDGYQQSLEDLFMKPGTLLLVAALVLVAPHFAGAEPTTRLPQAAPAAVGLDPVTLGVSSTASTCSSATASASFAAGVSAW